MFSDFKWLDFRSQLQFILFLIQQVGNYLQFLRFFFVFQVDKLSKKDSNENKDFGAKTLFPSHLTQAEVNRGVKSGKLLQGTFYQSRTNFQEGSFNCENLDKPVLIQGKNKQDRSNTYFQDCDLKLVCPPPYCKKYWN